jgi:hypothetical protein
MIPYDIEINEYVSYLDEMNNKSNFNSNVFIDFLKI